VINSLYSLRGPEIGVITKNPIFFVKNPDILFHFAKKIKKKINLRSDKSILMPPDQAKDIILKLIPKEAELKSINFLHSFSEVVIEAIKVGLVIGKNGANTKKIIQETGWIPRIVRAPITQSKILSMVRTHIYKNESQYYRFLLDTAYFINKEMPQNKEYWVRISALGGYREVGRKSTLIETPYSKILVDFGIHPNSKDAMPYLELIEDVRSIDAVIVTHAHMDHIGLVPLLYKLGYEGPTYCTPPTLDLMVLLQKDYLSILEKEGAKKPYSEEDIKKMILHTIPRDYGVVTDITKDTKITFYNAGHILGSSMVHFHFGNGQHNLLFSGDFKNGYTRLFDPINTKYTRLESLIIESTYGSNKNNPSRKESEESLLRSIEETLKEGGTVLIPVFSVGRAQEVMLVLEKFYKKSDTKPKVYLDGMIKEACAIHTAYPEYMKTQVKNRILKSDSPFESPIFIEVESQKQREAILKDGEPKIILSSSGMLTGGPSVFYFHKLCEDEKNKIIFVGYQAEDTFGYQIQKGLKEFQISENGKQKTKTIRMKVETIEGFSGHSYRDELPIL